jgi:hypothetical protein
VIPSAEEQVRFLQDVQRILQEGSFAATYKYALLLSLADISVERGDDSGASLDVTVREIADRFVTYYWRQARPYQPSGSVSGQVLKQNTGNQAAIISFVGRHQHSTIAQLKRMTVTWEALIQATSETIVDQPLWKLQVVGRETHAFLYPNTRSRHGVELNGRAVFCPRRFHSLIHDLVTAAWVRFVRQLPANRSVLGQTADLAAFLFGTERTNLDRYRPVLQDVQKECFYCSRSLTAKSAVDHFVPWSRYPIDLGHNFVLAHDGCNNKKRDLLAAVSHLERWVRRNEDNGEDLGKRFDAVGIAHDAAASSRIARWAYGQAESAGSLVWS